MTIEKLLSQINEEIQKTTYGTHPKELYEPISYLMALGGKRIRPLLVLLSYGIFRNDYKTILRPALAVEVFHNFTLMHDDIMDKAPLRRNQPTVHQKWNENIAILSGDVMLVSAYTLLFNIIPKVGNDKLEDILLQFNVCAAQVCEGQQLDMNFESLPTVSEEDYIKMIRLKTAVLLGFSLYMGAILADAPQEDANLLYDFGVNIGVGFQLKDDLLDVYGDKDKFGKQVGGDIAANKKTFLLIEALNLANETQKKNLDFWLAKTTFDNNSELEEKVNAVTSIYNELNIKELTEKKIQFYFDKAFKSLMQLHVTPARKQLLEGFTRDLINREN